MNTPPLELQFEKDTIGRLCAGGSYYGEYIWLGGTYGNITEHSMTWKNHLIGECISYENDGALHKHEFIDERYDPPIIIPMQKMVDDGMINDPDNITDEERLFIRLKYKMECLPKGENSLKAKYYIDPLT